MVKADSFMQMAEFMKEIGMIVRPTELAPIHMRMGHSTKDNGKMTYNTAMAKKCGQMVDHMKASIGMERNMGKVLSNGMMNPLILGTSLII